MLQLLHFVEDLEERLRPAVADVLPQPVPREGLVAVRRENRGDQILLMGQKGAAAVVGGALRACLARRGEEPHVCFVRV